MLFWKRKTSFKCKGDSSLRHDGQNLTNGDQKKDLGMHFECIV
jgi:hypothetical protein